MAQHRRLKWVVILPGIALAVLGQVWLNQGPDAWAIALAWRYAYIWNIFSLTVTLGLMIYRSLASPSALVRQQARIILLGAVLGLMPILVTLVWLATSQGWRGLILPFFAACGYFPAGYCVYHYSFSAAGC